MKPRSLVFFTGEVRFLWEHSIALRKVDRVEYDMFFRRRRLSLTFRKIRTSECSCPYVNFCDSQKKKLSAVSPLSDYNINIADKTQVGKLMNQKFFLPYNFVCKIKLFFIFLVKRQAKKIFFDYF